MEIKSTHTAEVNEINHWSALLESFEYSAPEEIHASPGRIGRGNPNIH